MRFKYGFQKIKTTLGSAADSIDKVKGSILINIIVQLYHAKVILCFQNYFNNQAIWGVYLVFLAPLDDLQSCYPIFKCYFSALTLKLISLPMNKKA